MQSILSNVFKCLLSSFTQVIQAKVLFPRLTTNIRRVVDRKKDGPMSLVRILTELLFNVKTALLMHTLTLSDNHEEDGETVQTNDQSEKTNFVINYLW